MLDLLITNQLTHLIASYGYGAVLLVVAIESMGVPVPGETTLLAASVCAGATHRLQVALVIGAAAAGAILGDNLGFLLGRVGGSHLLHRYGRDVRLDERRMRLVPYLFQRDGGKVVFFGRFVGVLRAWAAFLAGAHRMSWRRFLAFNAAGGTVWATLMGLGGYTFGSTLLALGGLIALAFTAVTMVVMTAVLLLFLRHEQRLQREAEDALHGHEECAARPTRGPE
jgi:membrane protein DedA with SNARE-associated domain